MVLQDISKMIHRFMSTYADITSHLKRLKVSDLHENGEKKRYFVVETKPHVYYKVTIEEL